MKNNFTLIERVFNHDKKEKRVLCLLPKEDVLCFVAICWMKGITKGPQIVIFQFSSFQWLSCVRLFATLWTAARQAFLSITNSELTQTHVHWVGDVIQPSHPLSSPSSPALNLSQHQGLSIESLLRIRWPKYWSFSFCISPSNEYSGLVSFRMDGWLSL